MKKNINNPPAAMADYGPERLKARAEQMLVGLNAKIPKFKKEMQDIEKIVDANKASDAESKRFIELEEMIIPTQCRMRAIIHEWFDAINDDEIDRTPLGKSLKDNEKLIIGLTEAYKTSSNLRQSASSHGGGWGEIEAREKEIDALARLELVKSLLKKD